MAKGDSFPYTPIGYASFYGGWSVDPKLATSSQFYYSLHCDFRKVPSQFSVLPGLTKLTNLSDLPTCMTQAPNGKKYLTGNAGYVYSLSTSNVLTTVGTLAANGAAGIVCREDVDHLYMTTTSGLGRIKYVSGSASFDASWFQRGKSSASTCYKTGGSNTYTLPTSISETATAMRTFVSDIEPLYSIKVKINAKGTGNWTLTLHDDANNVLGTSTVSNGSLTNGALNEFVFSSPVRAYVTPNGRTYHFHLTSTVADGSVYTTTASSLADCDMELWANALVTTNNGLHPMINFLQYTLIGNGRYVAAYEPLQDSPTTADFQRHRITLPPGYEVCGFGQKNLLCIIAAEKRSSSGEYQEGALFYWDGISETYNDWYPVPEGSPEGMSSHKNVVHYYAGGALYRISGTDEPVKIRTMRATDSEYSNATDTTHVYPNTMAVRRGILLTAYPSTSTNQSLEHRIYSFGAISREYPESFGASYTISTGTYLNNGTNNLTISLVKNYGDTLFVGWGDAGVYGLDIINNSSAPATSFKLESIYYDNNMPHRQKYCPLVMATMTALPSGTSVRLKYRLNGEASWTYGDYVTTGATYAKVPVEKPYIGLEFGIEGTVSGATPKIQSLQALVNTDYSEREIG